MQRALLEMNVKSDVQLFKRTLFAMIFYSQTPPDNAWYKNAQSSIAKSCLAFITGIKLEEDKSPPCGVNLPRVHGS